MRIPRNITAMHRFIKAVAFALAITSSIPKADAGITFTPGHIYSAFRFYPYLVDPGYRNIIEYGPNGNVVGSLVLPSLPVGYQLHGITFGPDGFLYAAVEDLSLALRVLVLDRSGTVHNTYRIANLYIGNQSAGKIAVDQDYIYVTISDDLVRFAVGDPNSQVSIYHSRDGGGEVFDVKILPNGNLFVATSYQVDEITDSGTIVRTVAVRQDPDLIDIRGIEYDPVTDKLFVSALGVLEGTRTLYRLNASTGVIEIIRFFFYADDLFLTESGNLVVGSRFLIPRIYNENLSFLHFVGSDQRLFVTGYRRTEMISKASQPSGSTSTCGGTSNQYSTGGSNSNLNHGVQYQFDWGDGQVSGWLPVGQMSASHVWTSPGTFSVKAQSRCANHTNVFSRYSDVISVTVKTCRASVADFNGDGHPDYVLWNPSTRQTALWYLNNSVHIDSADGPTLPRGWQLVLVADFNRDTHPDYVLVNSTTRQSLIGYLLGPTVIGASFAPTLPNGWELAAASDFNADQYPDYAIYDISSEQTEIVYLNDNTSVGSALGPTLLPNWSLVGAADFNGDGSPDYALFNYSNGQTLIGYLSGPNLIGVALGPTIPAQWVLAAIADFDGDSHPDYLLYKPGTRETAIINLDNNFVINAALGPSLPAGWSLFSQ